MQIILETDALAMEVWASGYLVESLYTSSVGAVPARNPPELSEEPP